MLKSTPIGRTRRPELDVRLRPLRRGAPAVPGALRESTAEDIPALLASCAADPVAACVIAQRVELAAIRGLGTIGGTLWQHDDPREGVCFAGGNLIPLFAGPGDLIELVDRIGTTGASAIAGRAELVVPLWEALAPSRGPAREVRGCQPLLAIDHPADCAGLDAVRRVRLSEFEPYLQASREMFHTEMGVDPLARPSGRSYRQRVRNHIIAGTAFAAFDAMGIAFKAEIGALSRQVGQIHGVWVRPDRRGQGLGAAGTAAVVNRIVARGRIASLYVNDFNVAARASYARVGMEQVGQFATVMLD